MATSTRDFHRRKLPRNKRATYRVSHEGGNGLLAVVQVHEPTDVALHVGLVAGVLELAAQEHHFVSRRLVFLAELVVLVHVFEAEEHCEVGLYLQTKQV